VSCGQQYYFAPLVVVGVANQFADLVVADGGMGGQVFFECAVSEVDAIGYGFTDQPAAFDQGK